MVEYRLPASASRTANDRYVLMMEDANGEEYFAEFMGPELDRDGTLEIEFDFHEWRAARRPCKIWLEHGKDGTVPVRVSNTVTLR